MKFSQIILTVCLVVGLQASTKPYKLKILHLVSLSGMYPFDDGISCRFAATLAIDRANSNSNILPDYHLELKFADERGGELAVRQAVDFVRDFEISNDIFYQSNTYQSPLGIAGSYSTGCVPLAGILTSLDMVAIGTECMSPSLEDRIKYPNFYMGIETSKGSLAVALSFITKVAKWNRFGIVANLENVKNFQMVMFFQRMAAAWGHSIAYVDAFIVADENNMQLLYKSGVRIIVLAFSFDGQLRNFFCEAYRQGIRGDRYVFLSEDVLSKPENLPEIIYPGCNRQMIIEQKMRTLVASTSIERSPNTPKNQLSFLGHTYPEFEEKLAVHTNNTVAGDNEVRYQCYDNVVRVVATLDLAEKSLRNQNLSLRNFTDRKTEVLKVVKQSLLEFRAVGLRQPGSMSYDSEGIITNGAISLQLWQPGSGYVLFGDFQQLSSSLAYSANSYSISWFANLTNYLRLPNDSPLLSNVNENISLAVVLIVILISAIIGLLQIVLLALLYFKRKVMRLPIAKSLGLVGCFILDASAVCLVYDTSYLLANIYIALTVLGAALCNALMYGAPLSLLRSISSPSNTHKATSNAVNRVSHVVSPIYAKKSQNVGLIESYKKADLRVVKLARLPLEIACILSICWLTTDAVVCGDSTEIKYVEKIDTTVTYRTVSCQTSQTAIWSASILIVQLIVLLVGFTRSYRLQPAAWPETPYVRLALINALISHLAIAGIVFIFPKVNARRTALAFGELYLSLTTTVVWLLPHVYIKAEIAPQKSTSTRE